MNFLKKYVILLGFFMFSASVFAEYSIESIQIDKITVANEVAMVLFTNKKIDNQDSCSSLQSAQSVALDLSKATGANYLYTHLMTAMVSKKEVGLTLKGCALINQTDSLPNIIAVGVSK